MRKVFLSLFIIASLSAFSQEINKHVSYTSVYDYLDELANMHVFELNSAVKPYSRKLIGEKLKEAETKIDLLTVRQQKDLRFFLKDYNKEYYTDKNFKRRLDLFYYKDSLFMFTLNPLAGYSYYKNENGSSFHRYVGADCFGTIGKHFGFYFSLRDNGYKSDSSKRNSLVMPNYLTQEPGANNKPGKSTNDFDDARGGISYGWKWGSVSFVKDNFVWGNNYNGSNIFSGRQPSFAYLNFKIKPAKWFEYNYIHGSLISQVLDTNKTYGIGSSLRQSFIPKYLAANIATIRPCKNFYFSIGNSVVYADKYIQPVYLIPFMFYPSADHTYNGSGSNAVGENSQMFLDVSCRSIPKTHLYTSVFIDEINLGKINDPAHQTNFVSFKGGVRFTNLLIKNTSLTFEYTRTNPWVYVHPINTIVFSSNNYNMGHYLGQNAEEIFVGLKIKPFRGVTLDINYTSARKGQVLAYSQTAGVNNNAGTPFMNHGAQWTNYSALFRIQYEVINDVFLFAAMNMQNIHGGDMALYTPYFYYGQTNTVNLGFNIGF